MSTVIKAEGLSKVYTIAHQEAGERSLRADLQRLLRRMSGRSPEHVRPEPERQASLEDFKALDNVSFEIRRGDRVGIIGRNGAGKSTLLKILSRVVEPTSGRIELHGRIASLLEVGTGFHPELTGRENIFLNGAVLGMSRRETARKLDEIIAFAEVEKFIDTPVKFYSSGMYVRLAFSVSAHLDPDVLILDEVLAVGDTKFQQKCMDKMRVVASEGRTLLFVSHSAQSITQLCQSAIWLDRGRVAAIGNASEVVQEYLATSDNEMVDQPQVETGDAAADRATNLAIRQRALYMARKADGDSRARLIDARVVGSDGRVRGRFERGEPFSVQMRFEILEPGGDEFVPNLHVYSADGVLLTIVSPPNRLVRDFGSGVSAVECKIPRSAEPRRLPGACGPELEAGQRPRGPCVRERRAAHPDRRCDARRRRPQRLHAGHSGVDPARAGVEAGLKAEPDEC
ncbi:ABC transporter ATP-binding protein [Ramlibacter montanisoli]|uniref:ATP-binding cassette domain-containing protein n=1 Tax=Ramlibacter montanisoli TaxID=2732512 RepID=A0A849KHR0_9BURK|nr:polysaccharide ABC transporter ATP-binding protein [Ramlibacter montanisoli]NNU44151.1 ATP-binding cassette domain-containing protein [Ramlibacter montanisoli]